MIRSRALIAMLASLGFALPGHGSAKAADLNVVVTIKPVHSIVAAVMQGLGEPKLLIDGTGSPHTFTLKPSDAKAINQATHFFRVSEGLEPFTGKIVKSLPKSVKVVTLESLPGLTLHPLRTGATFEAHADEKGGHNHGHAHGHGKKGGAKAETDGHIWLDPDNAKVIARHVAELFSAVVPSEANRLRANAEAFNQSVDAVKLELDRELKPLAGRAYLVFHDAYQYFERRFGLSPTGSVTVSPDVPPSAKRLVELRQKIVKLAATCVFAEPQFSPKIIETIVEKTNARQGVLDPLGAALPAGPLHYGTLMRALGKDLKSCLDRPS